MNVGYIFIVLFYPVLLQDLERYIREIKSHLLDTFIAFHKKIIFRIFFYYCSILVKVQ